MTIEKEKFFEILKKVSLSQRLNEDNLLQKIKEELHEIEKKLPIEDRGEYDKFNRNFSKEHQFSIKTSEEIAEDWTLLHLAVAYNNLLIVELLLKKKVSVNTRVKDGSNDDGLTALHIAASYGHENIIKLLLNDNRVNPSLESKNKTPREMVGNIQNRDNIAKILEEAENNYSPKEVKDLNIKIEGGGSYHLSQGNHRTPASLVVKGNNASTTPTNVIDTHSKRNDSIYSISDDSGLGLEQAQEEIEELKAQLGESRAQLEDKQKENQSLRNENATLKGELEKIKGQHSNDLAGHEARLKALKNGNATLNSKLGETKRQHSKTEALLRKAQEELAELKSRAGVGATNEGWTPLHSAVEISDVNVTKDILKTGKIDLNATDKDGWTLLHHAVHNDHVNKVKYLVEEGADFEIKDKNGKSPLDLAVSRQNNEVVEFLQEKIKSRTGSNEGELEKTGKRQFSSKIAYASLAAMLVVGAALSIASGLSALLVIAASVVSALIAGSVTYAISEPTTELKKVAIQDLLQHDGCKI